MKPFNLEHANAGAPVALEDGTEATIIKFDGRNEACPLVVLVGSNDRPHLASTKGYVSFGPMNSSKRLVMRPVGTLHGEPVYYGDKLLYRGEPIICMRCFATPEFEFDPTQYVRPPAYPVTRMTDEELDQSAMSSADHHIHLGQVANAAIRHGIDNGYLMSLEGRMQREIEIARHFYQQARNNQGVTTPLSLAPGWITAELTKVKS